MRIEATDPYTPLTCPICGKIFLPAPLHMYTNKLYKRKWLVCSYSCMRKSERLAEKKKHEKKRAAPQRLLITVEGKQYTAKELADSFNLSEKLIRDRHYRGVRGEDLIKPSRRGRKTNEDCT